MRLLLFLEKNVIIRVDMKCSRIRGASRVREILYLYKPIDLKKITVIRKIGAGSSSFVYLVAYEGFLHIVKELYPKRLYEQGILTRTSSGCITLRKWPLGFIPWSQAWHRCFRSIRTAYALQNDQRTAQGVVHISAIWIGNGSIYTITDDQNGYPWDTFTEESPERILLIGGVIAKHCHAIHQRNWLLIDIKASNFLVKQLPGEKVSVRLTDFDSVVPMDRVFRQKQFRCSSETAPPELLSNHAQYVGVQSDVYCLAAMLFRKLSGVFDREHIQKEFISHIMPRLVGWSKSQCDALLLFFLQTLDLDPMKRTASCQELTLQLQNILNQKGDPDEDL